MSTSTTGFGGAVFRIGFAVLSTGGALTSTTGFGGAVFRIGFAVFTTGGGGVVVAGAVGRRLPALASSLAALALLVPASSALALPLSP